MKRKTKLLWSCAVLMTFLTTLLLVFSAYLLKNGTSFDVLLYTLAAGTDGTNPGVIWDGFCWIVPRLLLQLSVLCLVIGTFLFILSRIDIKLVIIRVRRGVKRGFSLNRLISGCLLAFLLAVLPIFNILYINHQFGIVSYIKTSHETTTIYEEKYANPALAVINAPRNKKNLIFIWVESLETTYANRENGGFQEESCIPRLTGLALENIRFRSSENVLSGLNSVAFTKYTFGAMYAALSGTPYAYNVDTNNYPDRVVVCDYPFLSDVLKQNGYHCEYIVGCEGHFSGTDTLLLNHGFDTVFDPENMMEEGYIPRGYFENWGAEDRKVLAIAEDRITKIAGNGQPFAYMISTMDTHFPVGYTCPECPTIYGSETANIVACTDRLVADFVDWCRAQPFYEDTVIVIVGDHPRMDDCLVSGVPMEKRLIYNCFMNSAVPAENTENRCFTMMDLYPTVLSAMGFEIEGERLGFGTNLFCGQPTLTEEMGTDRFSSEISKHSDYFIQHFR